MGSAAYCVMGSGRVTVDRIQGRPLAEGDGNPSRRDSAVPALVPCSVAEELAADIRKRVARLREGTAAVDAGRLRVAGIRWDAPVDDGVLSRSPGLAEHVVRRINETLLSVDGAAALVESLAIGDAAAEAFAACLADSGISPERDFERDVPMQDPAGGDDGALVFADGLIEPVDGAADVIGRSVLILVTCHVWAGRDSRDRDGRPEWATGLARRCSKLLRATREEYWGDPVRLVVLVVADGAALGIASEGRDRLVPELGEILSVPWGSHPACPEDLAELIIVEIGDGMRP